MHMYLKIIQAVHEILLSVIRMKHLQFGAEQLVNRELNPVFLFYFIKVF